MDEDEVRLSTRIGELQDQLRAPNEQPAAVRAFKDWVAARGISEGSARQRFQEASAEQLRLQEEFEADIKRGVWMDPSSGRLPSLNGPTSGCLAGLIFDR